MMRIAAIAMALLATVSLSMAEEEWRQLSDLADKLLYEDGEIAKAIDTYNKAIALEPGNPGLHGNRGNAYSYQDNLDKALADYDLAIKLAVERAGSDKAKPLCYLYFNKAFAYDRVERDAEAIAYYERVVSIDKDYPDAHGNLAWILATAPDPALRDPKRAVVLATHELKRLGGKDPKVMDTLAAAYAAAGNFPEAVSWQQKAIELVDSEAAEKDLSERLLLYQGKSAYFRSK